MSRTRCASFVRGPDSSPLDIAWTYDPPWRAESPVSEFPHHNRSPPSTRAQPVPLSRTVRGSPAANAVSCASARQPATTCERSRPRARSSGRRLEERAPDGIRARSSARSAAGAVRKAQSCRRPPVAGRYGRASLMTPASGPTPPGASTRRSGSMRAVPGAARRSRCGAAPPGPRRPPCGRRSAPRRWSSIGLRRWDTPAAAGPDGRCALRGAGPGRVGKAKGSPAERIGVRLDVRPGELPTPPANAPLEHTAPAGPGAPVALARRHSRVQFAGISAPRRYRSR